MLTTQNDETSILERIKIARGNAEPKEPTEEPQIVDVTDSDTPEEEAEEVAQQEVEEIEEDETEEAIEETEEQAESEDELYLDLDGEEVPLSQVKKWKSEHMMQADYTRKTTELSEQRKEFEAEREAFNANQAKLQETVAQLESIIKTETLSNEDLQELREYEPERYIEYIEKQKQREEVLKEAKSQVKTESVDFQAEQQKLLNNNPSWVDNGQLTEQYQNDVKLLDEYAKEVGVTPERFATFDASMMQIMLDAARAKDTTKKQAAITKRVRKAPVSTKPSQKAKQGLHDQLAKAEKRLKQTGSVEDAMAVRKLKAKINN